MGGFGDLGSAIAGNVGQLRASFASDVQAMSQLLGERAVGQGPPEAAPTSAAPTASDTLRAARRPAASEGLPSVSTEAMINPPSRLRSVIKARRSSPCVPGRSRSRTCVRRGCRESR